MGTEYPGFKNAARAYWRGYASALIGVSSALLFTGALSAVVVLLLIPDVAWYLLLAVVSLALHTAALFLRDIRTGEYEPSQTSMSSPIELLAAAISLGMFQSAILFIGTGAAYLILGPLNGPTVVAAVAAAYYPVADLTLMRYGVSTPGRFVLLGALLVVGAIFNIHSSIVEIIPVVGRRQRPQS